MTFLFVFMYQACVLYITCSVVTDARVAIQSWPANRIGLAFPLRPNNHFLCLFFFISNILKTPMMLVNNAWHRLSLSARTFCFVVRQCTMNKIGSPLTRPTLYCRAYIAHQTTLLAEHQSQVGSGLNTEGYSSWKAWALQCICIYAMQSTMQCRAQKDSQSECLGPSKETSSIRKQ